MSGEYELTETAEDDLRGILQYITSQDGLSRAMDALAAFEAAFTAIAQSPGISFRRPHLTGNLIRWKTVFNFLVTYDPDTKPLVIMRIVHGARDLERFFSSEN